MTVLLMVKNFDLGGTEVHVRELSAGLVAQGHRVLVMAKDGRQVSSLDSQVTWIPHRFSDLGILKTVAKVRRLVQVEKIDLIHGHQRLPIVVAAIAGKLLGIPSVATIHGRIFLDARSRLIRRWLTQIIVVAPNRLDALSPHSRLRKKCHVVYNGLPAAEESPVKKRPPQVNLLYASRMDQRHSGALIEILKKVWPRYLELIPGAVLHVMGDGPELSSVKQAAAPLPTSVKIHGFVPSLTEQLRQTSITLGVGRVAIESLCLGVPVIPINSAHLAPVVSQENYTTLKENNFVGRPFSTFTADGLLKELRDTSASLEATWTATQYLALTVRDDFSLKKMIAQIERIYRISKT